MHEKQDNLNYKYDIQNDKRDIYNYQLNIGCKIGRAGHFQYFFIFSMIKNDFLHFLSS